MSEKAEGAAKNVASGPKGQVKKVRHFKKFGKVVGVMTPKKPAYEHQAVMPVSLKRNTYKIIKGLVSSDKATRKAEEDNTLVFWTDLRATKHEIARAVYELYHAKPVKVSTLVTSKCLKKAYVRLAGDSDATTLANQMA